MSSLLFYMLIAAAISSAALAIFFRRRWTLLAGLICLLGAGAVLTMWPTPAARTARGKRLIDTALPRYQFAERHQTRICASAERIAAAIKQVPADEIRWLGLLSSLRGLTAGQESDKPVLETALNASFVLLADTPLELVMATAGEFWRYPAVRLPSLEAAKGDPAAFAALELEGKPKAAINFAIEPAPFGCRLVTTETRIFAADAGMLGQFAAYWRVIQPGSALLRRSWLDAIRRRAEAQ